MYRDSTQIMEKHMEETNENEMESGLIGSRVDKDCWVETSWHPKPKTRTLNPKPA